MVAEHESANTPLRLRCSLAKISMVAELVEHAIITYVRCSLAKISMVAERMISYSFLLCCCSLAKISMVAELHLL